MKFFSTIISLLCIIPISGCSITPTKENNVKYDLTKNFSEERKSEININNNEKSKPELIKNESFKQKTILNIDTSVKLISPPTNLPTALYHIPEVTEKEEYSSPVKYVTKKTMKKDKHGKSVVVTIKEPIKSKKTNNNKIKEIKNVEKELKKKEIIQKIKKKETKKEIHKKESTKKK